MSQGHCRTVVWNGNTNPWKGCFKICGQIHMYFNEQPFTIQFGSPTALLSLAQIHPIPLEHPIFPT